MAKSASKEHAGKLKFLMPALGSQLTFANPPINVNQGCHRKSGEFMSCKSNILELAEMDGFDPVPRIQIVTVEQAMHLRDRALRLPARRDDAFKKATREEDHTAQGKLDV